MKYTTSFILIFLASSISLSGQGYTSAILKYETEEARLKAQLANLTLSIDSLNLLRDLSTIQSIGLPSENYLEYLGYYLEYSEEHEQALWTMHIINPRIQNIGVGRTNDFRVDNRIKSGTAEEIDYFTYDPIKDEYDGFGYDRGHLVPSADFRWSMLAMSDTYYYSNISPQLPEFNRELWAKLEDFGRAFVIKHNRSLVVVTIPVFDGGTKIGRSINDVTIPTKFAKAFLDIETKETIGFILNNAGSNAPLNTFIITTDEIERLTGYDLFPDAKAREDVINKEFWFDVIENPYNPIAQNTLPINHYNTQAASKLIGNDKEVWVCGKCTGGSRSRKGNLWINLDQKYPDNPFSGFVSKENLGHFQSSPLDIYAEKQICIKGAVEKWGNGSPLIAIKNSHYIKLYEN